MTNPQNGEVPALEKEQSVKKADYVDGASAQGSVLNFLIPAYSYHGGGSYESAFSTLPKQLPHYARYTFFQTKDIVLLATPHYEALWASAMAIATTKAAAWGWEVESTIPLRRKKAHDILMNSTAGVFTGFVPFISAHLRSFLLTGKAVVEIERESKAVGSSVVALHHLNPLRCLFTDDPKTPVLYYDRLGQIHELKWWQVMLFGDNVDPTEGEYSLVMGSAERAYVQIATMAAVDRFLYEKVTGTRALSIEFIQGITRKTLEDALVSSDHEMERRGSLLYKGVVTVPIPGDIPMNRVSIPLAEIPDGFDAKGMRDYATIVYAGATGMDVNDLDPRLAQARNLGSGAQSIVIAEKAKGKGLAAWRTQWANNMNLWVLDDKTTFTFHEENLDDMAKKADIGMKRAQKRATQVQTGEITNLESRNLAVDEGDLPEEFLQEDMTPATAIGPGDKPKPPLPVADPSKQPDPSKQQPDPQPEQGKLPKQQPQPAAPGQQTSSGQGSRGIQQKEFDLLTADETEMGVLIRDIDAYLTRQKQRKQKPPARRRVEEELDEAAKLARRVMEA